MNTLTLQGAPGTAVTVLSNEFLDSYMPKASGEFVKVYLYFLRYCTCPEAGLSLASAADTFCMTENDILRALKYWEREGLMALSYTKEKLSGIRMLPLPGSLSHAPQETQAALSPVPDTDIAAPIGDFLLPSAAAAPGKVSEKVNMYNGTPAYTARQMDNFKKNTDDQLFFVIEQYLGKPLGPTDVNKIVFFEEQLGFSSDLIEYLFEYCVSNNHYSIHYIEKTALAWAKDGIDTVAKARSRCTYYNKTSFDILKAFGISNRNPAPSEMEYIRRWTREYGFPMTIILEACRRTIEAIHHPSFAYAQSILEGWYENNVGSMDDIKKLDAIHEQERKEAAKKYSGSSQNTGTQSNNGSSTASERPYKAGNKFHNFAQRSSQYNNLEQSLLEKAVKRTEGR